MPAFKDENGREWLVRFDGPKIRDIRTELGVDFGKQNSTAFADVADDFVKLVDVLWVLCRGQASGLTAQQFGEALVGDAIERAVEALREAYLDFCPARQRSLLRCLAEKQAAMVEAGENLLKTKLVDEKLMKDYLAAVENQMDITLSNLIKVGKLSATSKPDSSASAPTDSRLPKSLRWPQDDAESNGSPH
jgi:hypothetical protein